MLLDFFDAFLSNIWDFIWKKKTFEPHLKFENNLKSFQNAAELRGSTGRTIRTIMWRWKRRANKKIKVFRSPIRLWRLYFKNSLTNIKSHLPVCYCRVSCRTNEKLLVTSTSTLKKRKKTKVRGAHWLLQGTLLKYNSLLTTNTLTWMVTTQNLKNS